MDMQWEMQVTLRGAVVKGDSMREGYQDCFQCHVTPPSINQTDLSFGGTYVTVENVSLIIKTQNIYDISQLIDFKSDNKIELIKIKACQSTTR